MRIAILAFGCVAAVAHPAAASEFAVLFVENSVAQVVDLTAARPAADGLAPLVLYSARRDVAPDGRAVYGEMQYRFKCDARTVRADGLFVYDAQFKIVFKQPAASPWRPVPTAQHMPELLDLACRGARPAGIKPLRAPNWMSAVQQARAAIP